MSDERSSQTPPPNTELPWLFLQNQGGFLYIFFLNSEFGGIVWFGEMQALVSLSVLCCTASRRLHAGLECRYEGELSLCCPPYRWRASIRRGRPPSHPPKAVGLLPLQRSAPLAHLFSAACTKHMTWCEPQITNDVGPKSPMGIGKLLHLKKSNPSPFLRVFFVHF